MDEAGAIVRLRDVVKSYPRGRTIVAALRGVTLDVPACQYLGVFGPSGSGKSTLLNVIAGVDVADGGSVRVLGRDLRQQSDDQLAVFRRRGIGVVYQGFNLIAALTLEENVALPLLLDGWSRRRAGERVTPMLAAVGLAERARHRPGQLSGGEMQRAAIARALVGDPKLLLADEPTGNLDTEQGETVLALLKELASRDGRAVIVVTHDPRAAAWCDRIIELRDGRVMPVGGEEQCGRRADRSNGKEELWATV